jgi:glycosyltransferase involved in cell wall biosynthesis
VAFHADDWFFIRDTGLISSTLRSLGVDSKTIMPLPWYDGDKQEHVIRTRPTNLRSVQWWKEQEVDAVILYSWGDPRYTLVARAIRKAGIKLIIHLDFNGHDFTPITKFPRALRAYVINKLRALHLSYAHTITTTPTADNFLRNNSYYGPSIADKLHPFVTPVAPYFRYNGEKKEPTVLCIGNWTLPVKRPEFMRNTIAHLLAQHPTVKVEIYGKTDEAINTWHASLPPEQQQRVHLAGFADNASLPDIYNRSQICLCASESEGTHISSAEALCCGCSIVTTNRPERLPMVHWYTTKSSGSIAEQDSPASVASAVIHELAAWQQGERNPGSIASTWQPFFRADIALSNLFHL